MESQALAQTSPQTGDGESTMRRNLGLDGALPSSSASDPLKAARQAIRSQTAAREYTERQLAQAQSTIQDLRTRLHHIRQEKDAAIAAAQSALAAKDTAEGTMRAAEKWLATERANRARTEGMLRDAQATILDLRKKLAAANQTLHATQAELAAERRARSSVNDGEMLVPETVVAAVQDGGDPTVRRPVGRPRKVAVVETAQTTTRPSEKRPASRDDSVPPNVDVAVQAIRGPVGTPRKIVVLEPTSTLMTPPKKLPVITTTVRKNTAKPVQKVSNRVTDDQEPVQWWVEGWKGR